MCLLSQAIQMIVMIVMTGVLNDKQMINIKWYKKINNDSCDR